MSASWRRRGGPARGVYYGYGEAPVMAEASVAGRMAEYRAEILRLRVLCGDLRAPE